jgi:hypothetical protein
MERRCRSSKLVRRAPVGHGGGGLSRPQQPRSHWRTVCLPALVLLVGFLVSAPPARSDARDRTKLETSPLSAQPSRPPWPLRIQLAHRVLLDRNPKAGQPDPHAKVGPLPREFLTTGLVPSIVVDSTVVTFLSSAGEPVTRVPLSKDPNLAVRTFLSPHATCVSIASTFSSRVSNNEADEGGSWPDHHKIYDRNGRVLYTTQSSTDDLIHLADNGNAVFVSYHTGAVTFIDPATGQVARCVQPLPGNVTARPRISISADGQRVLVLADRTVLDTEYRTSKLQQNIPDLMRRGRREVWAIMYDITGREQWRKLLPVHGTAERAALSDDGSLGLLIAEILRPIGLAPAEPIGTTGYMVDPAGTILASSDLWGAGVSGAHYSAQNGGFLLGASDGSILDVARPDGSTKRLVGPPSNPTPGVNELARDAGLYKKRRLVLVLMDEAQNVLFFRNIGGSDHRAILRDERDFDPDGEGPDVPNLGLGRPQGDLQRATVRLSPDARMVAVRFEREIRVWRIVERNSAENEGRR